METAGKNWTAMTKLATALSPRAKARSLTPARRLIWKMSSTFHTQREETEKREGRKEKIRKATGGRRRGSDVMSY